MVVGRFFLGISLCAPIGSWFVDGRGCDGDLDVPVDGLGGMLASVSGGGQLGGMFGLWKSFDARGSVPRKEGSN